MGDGTTSVVVLAGEILKEIKEHVEQGVSSQIIIKGLRKASSMAVNKIKEIAIDTDEGNRRETLGKLAATAMTSKLIKRNADFFTKSLFSFLFYRLSRFSLLHLVLLEREFFTFLVAPRID